MTIEQGKGQGINPDRKEYLLQSPNDIVLTLGETKTTTVTGVSGQVETTPFIFARKSSDGGATFALGLLTSSSRAKTLQVHFEEEKSSLDYVTAWRALQFLSSMSAYGPFALEASVDLVKGRHWAEKHHPATSEYASDVNQGQDLSPEEYLTLALGGIQGIEDTYRRVLDSSPTEHELQEVRERLEEFGIQKINLGGEEQ